MTLILVEDIVFCLPMMQIALLITLLAVATANYDFETGYHLILLNQYNGYGLQDNLTLYTNFDGVNSFVGGPPTINPPIGVFNVNLTEIMLDIAPTAYGPLTDGSLSGNMALYDDPLCSILFRIGFLFPSIGSHYVSWVVDSDAFLNGVNMRKQQSANYYAHLNMWITGNLTLINQNTNVVTSKIISFSYLMSAWLNQISNGIFPAEFRYPAVIIDEQLYFPVPQPAQSYNTVFTFDGVYIDIRDDGNYAQSCSTF